MTTLFPQGEAQFSSDGVYRFRLTRELGDAALDGWRYREIARRLVFVMLNPSTADADKDDPTIRRCKGYGLAWGYHKVVIVNLYAFRATDPKMMWQAALAGTDIVGAGDNDTAITRAVCEAYGWPTLRPTDKPFEVDLELLNAGMVICAWGAASSLPKALRDMHRQRVEAVRKLVGKRAYVLKVNDDGSPVHPLYQPDDIIPWALPDAVAL